MKSTLRRTGSPMKIPRIGETVWFLASDVVMTSDIDIIAPMERS